MKVTELVFNKFIEKPSRMDNSTSRLAKRYGCTEKEIMEFRETAKSYLADLDSKKENTFGDSFIVSNPGNFSHEVNNEAGTLKSQVDSDFEPKNDVELAKLHKVDLKKYKISNYWTKNKPNGTFTSSLLCTLRKKDSDLPMQKEAILNEIKEFISEDKLINSFNSFTNELYENEVKKRLNNKTKNCLLEIDIFDHHFGKLVYNKETGEDYDLDIASELFKQAVTELLVEANLDNVSKIIMPIGNDLIHVDNEKSQTTKGTQIESDSRFTKIVKTTVNVLTETLLGLSAIAPVDVVIIPGNHDQTTMFMVGEILSAFFHSNNRININNEPTLRKYYEFGINGFMYTHGDKEKHSNLGMIFATEQAEMWGRTKNRVVKLGHFHKAKTLSYLSLDTHTGFQIQVLPSLSAADFWHVSHGFLGERKSKAFLYDEVKGEIANYTFSI